MGHFVEKQRLRFYYHISLGIVSCVLLLLGIFNNKAFSAGFIIAVIWFVLALSMKLEVHIYDDRIEYRLSPFHKSSTIVFLDSIKRIDIIDAKQLGVIGFKIKNNVRRIYYFGGGKLLRIQSDADKDTYIGIRKYTEVEKLLRKFFVACN